MAESIPSHIYYQEIPDYIKAKLHRNTRYVTINGDVLRIEYGAGNKVSAIERNRRMNGSLV